MALWFLDSTNGDDAYDGEQTALMTGVTDKTALGLTYSSPIYRIKMASEADAELLEVQRLAGRDIIHVSKASDPTNHCWLKIAGIVGDIVGCSRFTAEGDDISAEASVDIIGTGPVKTITKLLTLIASGDRAYSIVWQGGLAQIYPEPISELVALALKETLETITLTNGYAFDIGTVIRPTSLTVPILADKQVVMRQPADRIADEAAAMFEHHKQEFELFLMIRVGETDTVALDTYANRFHAAVRKALTADVTLGGACIDLAVGDLEMVDSDDAIATYALDVTATYRHEDDDPYPAA